MLILKRDKKLIFTGNLAQEGNADTKMFFIIEEAKETVLDFFKYCEGVPQFILL